MIEAAIVSLRFGLDHFLRSYEDPQRLRQAIIDIHVGIELLLKERLMRESPLFIMAKIDEQAALRAHAARNEPRRPIPADHRTVGFDGALARLDALKLLPVTVDRLKLARLNHLRNELVHTGSSESLDEGLRLIARDAVTFLDTFMSRELNVEPSQAFGTNAWSSVKDLAAKVSDKVERQHHERLARHRGRASTLTAEELEERLRREIEFRGVAETLTTQCPACEAEAYVGIDYDVDVEEDGPISGSPYLTVLQCAVCELRLEDDSLDQYQDLADELMRDMYADMGPEPDDDDDRGR